MIDPVDRPPIAVHPLRRLVHNLVLVSTVLAGAALAFAALYPIDPLLAPDGTATLELQAVRIDALRFPLGVGLCGCAGLLFLTRYPGRALGALLLATWAIVPTLRLGQEERPPREGADALRVLSLNLAGDHATTERVVRAVRAADVDVVLFQEYTPARHPALLAALGGSYPTQHHRARTDSFGMAVYARVPLRDVSSFYLADSRTPQFRMVVTIADTSVALYSIHLVPVVAHLYPRHRREYVDLLQRAGEETMPVILAGDFNFVNHSAFGEVLRKSGYLDAHLLSGTGRGATWPTQLMQLGVLGFDIPGIRLDHIFVGRTLSVTESWTGAVTGSDHLPIGAAITQAE